MDDIFTIIWNNKIINYTTICLKNSDLEKK